MSLVATVIPLAAGVAAAQVTCFGQPATVQLALGQVPTTGDDVIVGTPGDDVIAASDGDDLVCGLGGNDSIWGQNGNDALDGGDGNDRLRGGSGDDVLRGRGDVDDLAGGPGADDVDGGAGSDSKVRGGGGDDIVNAGAGNDVLVTGNGGRDQVDGGPGDDVLITGGPRPDVVRGGDGHDLLKGNKGADELFGGAGADDLRGGPQADILDGGTGTDTCSGGTTGLGAPEADQASNCELYNTVESFVAVGTGSFVWTAVDSGLVLAPDGVGPNVMLASVGGAAAVWRTIENTDGSFSLLNSLTDRWLAVQGDTVVLEAEAGVRSRWRAPVVGPAEFALTIDGRFVRSDGPALRLTTVAAEATTWSLGAIPEPSQTKTIANAASGLLLTGTSDADQSRVRVAPGEGLHRGFWMVHDVVASTEPCTPVAGLPRCVVIVNTELDQALAADSFDTTVPVKSVSAVDDAALWEVEQLGDGSFMLNNVVEGGYLTQNGLRSVTTDPVSSDDAAWMTSEAEIDASGCPVLDDAISVTTHAPGDIVDVSATGSGTGAFLMSGTAPARVQEVTVLPASLASSFGSAAVERGLCSVSWAIEIAPTRSGDVEFDISATFGLMVQFLVAETKITLSLVAPA